MTTISGKVECECEGCGEPLEFYAKMPLVIILDTPWACPRCSPCGHVIPGTGITYVREGNGKLEIKTIT